MAEASNKETVVGGDLKKTKLGYWGIRGLAQPIRFAFHFAGVDFEEKRYHCVVKEDGSHDRSAWTSVKYKLGMQFPNLPYICDGDLKMVESVAVLTYACEKGGLYEKFTIQDKAKALSLALSVQDLRNMVVGLFYGRYDGPNGPMTKAHGEKAKKMFADFNKVLDGKKWLLGDDKGPCAADFHLCEMIYQHFLLDPSIFKELPQLLAYAKDFFAIENIKKLEAQCAADKLAMNNTMAKFGASYIEGKFDFKI